LTGTMTDCRRRRSVTALDSIALVEAIRRR
jgi:hypothetical protein